MGKQILTTILTTIKKTLVWTVIFFIIIGAWKSLIGVESWLIETLDWVIPLSVGVFIGYGQASIDRDIIPRTIDIILRSII